MGERSRKEIRAEIARLQKELNDTFPWHFVTVKLNEPGTEFKVGDKVLLGTDSDDGYLWEGAVSGSRRSKA